MDANQLNELAIIAPLAVSETEAEAVLREQAKETFFRINYDTRSESESYDAGWKAAKAYYEALQ